MADWKELNKLSKEEKAKVKYNDPRLDSFAGEVENKYGLPKGLILSVKNAGERSNTSQVSPKGAKGVMQFIDKTRKAYPHDYLDPLASIDAAGRYFSDLLKQYKGNAIAAVAAYNGGTKAGNAVLKGEEIPYEETRGYVSRIQNFMREQMGEMPKELPAPTKKEQKVTPGTYLGQQQTYTDKDFDPRLAEEPEYAKQVVAYINGLYGNMFEGKK